MKEILMKVILKDLFTLAIIGSLAMLGALGILLYCIEKML
jgi:hypothetical protein